MAIEIHPSAVVGKKAVIGENVVIGPFCIVGDGVKLQKGVRLCSHVVVEGLTDIGEGTIIHPFSTIGLAPQDLKYKDEPTGVRIGRTNTIREYTSIHRGSVGGEGLTVIGDSNFIMAYSHIAHDCRVGNSNIMVNAATLAGHVVMEDYITLGGIVAVHQHARIGSYAMVGGLSGVSQDIPPYTLAAGERVKLYGLNVIGLKRRGFSDDTINTLKKAYKILFREKQTLKEALKRIAAELPDIPEVRHLVEFIEENKRGICR